MWSTLRWGADYPELLTASLAADHTLPTPLVERSCCEELQVWVKTPGFLCSAPLHHSLSLCRFCSLVRLSLIKLLDSFDFIYNFNLFLSFFFLQTSALQNIFLFLAWFTMESVFPAHLMQPHIQTFSNRIYKIKPQVFLFYSTSEYLDE